MANSLMELYGGGITGEPTSYYTGGAVSRAKIASKYRDDYHKIKEAHDENVKNMGFWSNVGNIGGFVADMFLPGSGGVVRAGAESFYRPEEVGDVDFALDQKEKAEDISDTYREGILGRGVTSSLSSMLMPEIYEDFGEKAKTGVAKGLSKLPEFLQEKIPQSWAQKLLSPEELKELEAIGNAYKDNSFSSWDSYLQEMFGVKNSKEGSSEGTNYLDIIKQQLKKGSGGSIPKMPQGGYVNESYTPPTNPTTSSNPYGFNMNASNGVNQYGVNTDALSNLTSSGWNIGDATGGALFGAGSGMQGIVSDPNKLFTPGGGTPGAAGTFSPYGDYGKQRGIAGALEAAGMGDKMKDPEFAKYMKYLPTFDMGYEQKIADYRTGAQDSLFGMTAPMGPSETTFSGSGAAKKLRETSRKKTTDIYGRQERGVGEDYIKDVLAGVTAAEAARNKGAFGVDNADDNSGSNTFPPNPEKLDYDQYTTYNGKKYWWEAAKQEWIQV